ncbi:unnamed protein product [Cylicocyclus nassatus]|uniref:SXP/RAL-2 family protein Ani s 5-like cation-binding domain-containing protein n=1 Tax=Cylicocyclus nassatus TaxID=53992 RepID=A0AA36M8B4_CYLNA|nr:unnamed protein product [Cylicocyclus nassatus]
MHTWISDNLCNLPTNAIDSALFKGLIPASSNRNTKILFKMRTLLLLAALICTVKPLWIFNSIFDGFWNRYPFLRGAKWEARKEFSDIINNSTMTKGERQEAMERWAENNDLSEAYQDYVNATEEARKERQRNIAEILDVLPAFFESLNQIEKDLNLTYNQERDAKRNLCSTIDVRGRHVADFLLDLYHVVPRYTVKPKVARSLRDMLFEDLSNTLEEAEGFFNW